MLFRYIYTIILMQVSAMKAYFQITEYCLSFAEVQPIFYKDRKWHKTCTNKKVNNM